MKVTEVVPGIFRGSRPKTHGDFYHLRNLNIKIILNLEGGLIEAITRVTNEEQKFAICENMQTIRIEMNALFPPGRDDVNTCMQILNRSYLLPIYVHCAQGVDRTGYVIAACRMKYCGWSADKAIEEMKALGFHWWYWYWIPSLRRLK